MLSFPSGAIMLHKKEGYKAIVRKLNVNDVVEYRRSGSETMLQMPRKEFEKTFKHSK